MKKNKRKENECNEVKMEAYEDAEEIMKVIRRITAERSEGHDETDKK